MISAVVLTHNDATIVRKCLVHLAWCDEVVVIDDESTDGTVQMAKKFGAHVYSHALHDDFGEQRNFGLSKAAGDWVFFVDSDELVTKELAAEIASSMTPRNDNISGYFIKRKDFFEGTWLAHGETAHVKLLRLAKKDAGLWDRPVHEVWMVHGPVGTLKESLLHFPHPNVAQFLEEINHYSSLRAQFLYRNAVRVRWWHIPAYPAAKFFVNYFWRLGFLDGTAGAVMAIMMSFHSFLVRAKLWQLHERET